MTTSDDGLDATTRAVRDAVAAACGAPVHLAPTDADGAHVWLVELRRAGAARGVAQDELRFAARYVVSFTRSDDPLDAHARLGRIVAALADHADWALDTDGIDTELWRAVGVPPRPAIAVLAPWRVERRKAVGPPALRLGVEVEGITSLRGAVVGIARGDGDTALRAPLAGASVRAPALGRSAITGRDGTFVLDGIRATGDITLHVAARGRQRTVRLDPAAAQPLEIEIDMDGATR
ncbi:MAG: carboxypeptidase regulatory-like domain-containing protein [Planctomycetes bacterium]|nr:carboxypeptidase regulatory-like domain-containing protein [Planctomycetota bacterium]